MSPAAKKRRLMEFLINNTDIYSKIFDKTADDWLAKLASHTTELPDRDHFINSHFNEIDAVANKTLDAMCDNILKDNAYKYLFTQISLFALFLLPPIYPLIRYAIAIWQTAPLNISEFSVCVASVCLLLMLMGAAAYALLIQTFGRPSA